MDYEGGGSESQILTPHRSNSSVIEFRASLYIDVNPLIMESKKHLSSAMILYVCMYIRMYVCIYVHICMYVYTLDDRKKFNFKQVDSSLSKNQALVS